VKPAEFISSPSTTAVMPDALRLMDARDNASVLI